eukprot:6969074-Alexandrium_andersonii.AAC.2
MHDNIEECHNDATRSKKTYVAAQHLQIKCKIMRCLVAWHNSSISAGGHELTHFDKSNIFLVSACEIT